MRAGIIGAFVELHGNIGAKQIRLNFDAARGRQPMRGAINVALEGHTIGIHLAQLRERPDLKAATVGQHRAVPVRKAMQAAETLHALCAGSQHQMIGVAEDDIRPGLLYLVHIERLDRAGRAHRHEGGRADFAARCLERARTGLALGRLDLEWKYRHGPRPIKSMQASA